MQLQHQSHKFQTTTFPVILLCNKVNSPANIGSLLRIADSFGIEKVVFGEVEIDKNSSRLKRTARSTQNWVVTEDNVLTLVTLKEKINAGYYPIALEITEQSQPIDHVKLNTAQKIILVIGEENEGISDEVLDICKEHRHVTMFGKNSSMNVAQATAIALYEITKQLHTH